MVGISRCGWRLRSWNKRILLLAFLVFGFILWNITSGTQPVPKPLNQTTQVENPPPPQNEEVPEEESFYTLTPRSHRHCFRPPKHDPQQLHVVVWVSNQDHPTFTNFLLSMNRLGYKNLHIIKPYRHGYNESVMWKQRIYQLREFFATQPSDTLILATDSYDVMFAEGPEELVSRYVKLGHPVVIGAEILCDTMCCRHNPPIRTKMMDLSPTNNLFSFINGGTVMGRRLDIMRVFDLALERVLPGEDDQIAFSRTYIEFPELLGLDYDSHLFGVIPPSTDLIDREWRLGAENLKPSDTPADHPAWAFPHRAHTDLRPAVLHFPGVRYENSEYQLFNPCQIELGNVYSQIGRAMLAVSEEAARKARVVVSMTTIPQRLANLLPTIVSVMNQTLPPTKIYLNLAQPSEDAEGEEGSLSRFGGQHYEIPPAFNDLPVTVNWCNEFGPATKLIPTLQVEQDPDTVIITVDDDMIYPPFILMELTRHILAYPHAAFGYAGQIIDTQGRYPIVRSADEWRGHLDAVDILEAFKGAAYMRKFFDDSIERLNSVCYRTDDIHISAHLARKWIPRIKLAQRSEDAPRPSANDVVAPLREENVYGTRKNDICAAALLDAFTPMWTDAVTACPVRFESLHLPPLKDFPLGPHYTPEMPVLKCNSGSLFQIAEGATKLKAKQYFKQGHSIYSPGGTRLTLMPQGRLCITHLNGDIHCLPSPKMGKAPDYYVILNTDGKLCVMEGKDPMSSGPAFHCMTPVVSGNKCPVPTLSVSDEGVIGMACLL